LLFSLQADLTTGETWEMLNKKPADSKYLILLYERVITRFETLKKVADQNSPAIQSIIRNVSYIDDLIADEYKDKNSNDQWASTYNDAKDTFINKLAKINRVSDYYGEQYSKKSAYQRGMGERLIDMLDFQNKQKILDFGCGDGTNAIKMAETAKVYVDGFDASKDSIRIANQKKVEKHIANVKFWIEDANHFDTRNTYDIVFSNFVINWVGVTSFAKMFNALKSGGQMISATSGSGDSGIQTPNKTGIIWDAVNNLGFSKYFNDFKYEEYIPKSSEQLKNAVEKAGFKNAIIEKVETDQMGLYPNLEDVYESKLLTILNGKYRYLETKEQETELFDECLKLCMERKPKLVSVAYVIQARKEDVWARS
jgi:cyclopropane fatty-acyl-phospholipid synthase-like methyltransferase